MVTISGGDKLEKALAELSKKVTKAATTEVGFMSDATYEDGKSVAMVAALNEFGHGSTPPRPFFRTMISEKSPDWPDLVAQGLKNNDFDAYRALTATGAVISADLQESISNFSGAPLSPVTIMLRGMRTQSRYKDMPFWERFAIAKQRVAEGKTSYSASSTPLIDTNVMRNSATYRVD